MFLDDYIDENYKIKTPEHFNFAFDVVDRFATEDSEKIALVWCNDKGNEKILTFGQMAKNVNKAANVLKSLGIKKGDSVMLILRRRYEFWYMLLALHKIGAIAVPATVQLLTSDIVYRIEKAHIKMIVALNAEQVVEHIENALEEFSTKPENLEKNQGYVKTMWCGDAECEEKVHEHTGAKSRCMPFEQEHISDTCVYCGKKADKLVVWGRQY